MLKTRLASLEQYHGLFTSNMLSDWTPMLCARLKSSDNYLTGHRTLKKDTGLEQDTLFLGIFLSPKIYFNFPGRVTIN